MITTLEKAMSIITIDKNFIKRMYIGNILVYQQFLSNIKMSILDDYTLSGMDDISLGDMLYQVSLRDARLSELDSNSLRNIDNSVL